MLRVDRFLISIVPFVCAASSGMAQEVENLEPIQEQNEPTQIPEFSEEILLADELLTSGDTENAMLDYLEILQNAESSDDSDLAWGRLLTSRDMVLALPRDRFYACGDSLPIIDETTDPRVMLAIVFYRSEAAKRAAIELNQTRAETELGLCLDVAYHLLHSNGIPYYKQQGMQLGIGAAQDSLPSASLAIAEIDARFPNVESWIDSTDSPLDPGMMQAILPDYVQLKAEAARETGGATLTLDGVEMRDRLFQVLLDNPNSASRSIRAVRAYLEDAERDGMVELEVACDRVKRLVDSQEPSLMTWSARYLLAYALAHHSIDPQEAHAQYKTMFDQLENGFVRSAMAHPDVTDYDIADIQVLCGHVCMVMNDLDAAEAHYNLLISEFPEMLDKVRTAAYSKALVRARKRPGNTRAELAELQSYLEQYPYSVHASEVKLRVAKKLIKASDLGRAQAILQGLILNHPRSDESREADRLLQELVDPSGP